MQAVYTMLRSRLARKFSAVAQKGCTDSLDVSLENRGGPDSAKLGAEGHSCSADGDLRLENDRESDASGGDDTLEITEKDPETALEKTRRAALLARETARRKGVLYVSRIPPHLKPQKLRHVLSQYGELGRLYLAPEDPSLRKRRKRLKGNSGKNFSEGWVEFLDKRVAKRVAAILNGQPMGGKRRSAFHYDLWCLKYLPKFKWDFLTEEIAYQKAVRDQKLAAEISAAKKERDFYLSRVDRAKAADARHKRQQKREAGTDGSAATGELAAAVATAEGSAHNGQAGPRIVRSYGQRKAKPDPADDAEAPVLSQEVLALLGGRR